MAWTPPNLRSTGYRVPASVWNAEVVENLLALSTHSHSGAAGDGAALVVPRPILHQNDVLNTVGPVTIWSDTVLGNAMGVSGYYAFAVWLNMLNAGGGAPTLTFNYNYGAGSLALLGPAMVSGANARLPLFLTGRLANLGVANQQRIALDVSSYGNLAGSLGGTLAGTRGGSTGAFLQIWNTLAIDSTALQALSISIAISAAGATIGFEVVGGYVLGPIYGP